MMARKKKKTTVKSSAAAAAAAVTVTEAENNCRSENALQKYWCEVSLKLGKPRWCAEEEDSSKKVEEESAAAAAVTEVVAVTGAEDSCQCCNELQKFWCDEFLKLRQRRRCLEREDSAEKTENSAEKTEDVNYFKIVWEKDGIL